MHCIYKPYVQFQEPSRRENALYLQTLCSIPKAFQEKPLEAHFKHFWAQLAKWRLVWQ